MESGKEHIRKMIHRHYRDDTLVRDMRIITDEEIRLSTFNIIGFPGEIRANLFETMELNRRTGSSSCISIFSSLIRGRRSSESTTYL